MSASPVVYSRGKKQMENYYRLIAAEHNLGYAKNQLEKLAAARIANAAIRKAAEEQNKTYPVDTRVEKAKKALKNALQQERSARNKAGLSTGGSSSKTISFYYKNKKYTRVVYTNTRGGKFVIIAGKDVPLSDLKM